MKTYKATVIETITREVHYTVEAYDLLEAEYKLESSETRTEEGHEDLEVIARSVEYIVEAGEECS